MYTQLWDSFMCAKLPWWLTFQKGIYWFFLFIHSTPMKIHTFLITFFPPIKLVQLLSPKRKIFSKKWMWLEIKIVLIMMELWDFTGERGIHYFDCFYLVCFILPPDGCTVLSGAQHVPPALFLTLLSMKKTIYISLGTSEGNRWFFRVSLLWNESSRFSLWSWEWNCYGCARTVSLSVTLCSHIHVFIAAGISDASRY